MATPKMEESNSLMRQLSAANEEAWLALGRIADMMGDDQNTMIAYEKVLSHNRMNATALSAIGCVYEKMEDYTKAADCFRGLVSLNEQNSDAWGHLGYCCLMMNDLTSAHTAYQYAMYNNPTSQKDPNMWYGIGQLYERLGSLEHAQESFEAVLRFEPNFNMALEVKFRLGIIAKQRGDYDSALESLKSVLGDVQANLQTTDMASDIWTQIGHVYELKSEVQSAKSSYLKVAELNPKSARPMQQLGWLCLKHSEHASAIDYLKKAVALDPQDGKGWYLLGRCYMVVHEFEEAYDAYKHAVTTDAQNPNVWCSLGVLFYQLNQHLDALDAYSRAINISSNICEVWYNVGTLYDTCNQTSDARDAYQKAAELGADAQFIRERLDLLRAREAGQPTAGLPGANSAPGPSEPPTTSPMPTFTSRPASETPPPAQQGPVTPVQQPRPITPVQATLASNGPPRGTPGGAPMQHMLRGGHPMSEGGSSMGNIPTSSAMLGAIESGRIATSGPMEPGRGQVGNGMMRNMPANLGMNGSRMPRGPVGGGMPSMQHSQPLPNSQQHVQPRHTPAPQPSAHHAQAAAQAHHHAQMQAHHAAQATQNHHMQHGDRRSMPGRPAMEDNKGAMRYPIDGDRMQMGPPPTQRLGSFGSKGMGPLPGPHGPPQGRMDRFQVPMGSQKLPHPSMSMAMPPGRRKTFRFNQKEKQQQRVVLGLYFLARVALEQHKPALAELDHAEHVRRKQPAIALAALVRVEPMRHEPARAGLPHAQLWLDEFDRMSAHAAHASARALSPSAPESAPTARSAGHNPSIALETLSMLKLMKENNTKATQYTHMNSGCLSSAKPQKSARLTNSVSAMCDLNHLIGSCVGAAAEIRRSIQQNGSVADKILFIRKIKENDKVNQLPVYSKIIMKAHLRVHVRAPWLEAHWDSLFTLEHIEKKSLAKRFAYKYEWKEKKIVDILPLFLGSPRLHGQRKRSDP